MGNKNVSHLIAYQLFVSENLQSDSRRLKLSEDVLESDAELFSICF